MNTRKKILAICGSTRENSSNLILINAIRNLSTEKIDVLLFHGLAEIPHFNPDLDNNNPPKEVINFRKQLIAADAILVCTPEYAMGVPGTLKNAIDWTVSSMEFSHKPTALITASTSGQKGHLSLLETLRIIEADMDENTQLLIAHIKTKLNDEEIIDKVVLEKILKLVDTLIELIEKRETRIKDEELSRGEAQ
jgi:chromate reductase, NAD(P)H dehydrogenase (quinone)